MVLRLLPLVRKYFSGCGGYDQSIFNRLFNVFLPVKNFHLLYIVSSDLKHVTSFWFNSCIWMTCPEFLLYIKNTRVPMAKTASIPVTYI